MAIAAGPFSAVALLLANGEGETWGVLFGDLPRILLAILWFVACFTTVFMGFVLPAVLGAALAVRKGRSPLWLCLAVVPSVGWIVYLILRLAPARPPAPGRTPANDASRLHRTPSE